MNNPLPPSIFSGWLPYVQAFGPSVVALIAAVVAGFITWYWQSRQNEVARAVKDIAYSQSVHAETKLRLELFEHRFKAYQNVQQCVAKVLRLDYVHNGNYHIEFASAIEPIKYLFDKELHKYLQDNVRLIVQEYRLSQEALTKVKPDDLNIEEVHEHANLFHMHLIDALTHIDRLAYPYLVVEQGSPLLR